MPRGKGKRYNQRKLEILTLLQEGDLTVEEIVEEVRVESEKPINVISSCLQKYKRHGLVEGEKSVKDGRRYVYSITRRGKDRISWLRKEEEEKGGEDEI